MIPADAAAAFVDEILGSAKHQQLLAIKELWGGVRRAYPGEFGHPWKGCDAGGEEPHFWLPYGAVATIDQSQTRGQSSNITGANQTEQPLRKRSRSPSSTPARHWVPTAKSSARPGVLFHCVHGTSRSATVLAAVLLHRRLCTGASWLGSMQLNEHTLRTELAPCSMWNFAAGVVRIVQLARPQVQPNAGFLQQLHDFHVRIQSDETVILRS
jgi:hypothetical protein